MFMILTFVIGPVLSINTFNDGINMWQFFLLLISTLLISIGGYIINDIADINPDSINKPGKNIISNEISIKNAYRIYWIVTIVGVLMGTGISYFLNQTNFGLIFLFSAGLLWYYSQKYQCQPFIGNIVIAVLSSVSFGLVWLFEFSALSNNAIVFVNAQSKFPFLTSIVFIYMGFAFLVTLLREIIKDAQDYKGDNRFGCRTLAVIYGLTTSRNIAIIIAYISLLASIFAQYFFLVSEMYFMVGGFMLVDIMFLIIIFHLHRDTVYQKLSYLSLLLKIIMLIGIFTMIIIKFEF